MSMPSTPPFIWSAEWLHFYGSWIITPVSMRLVPENEVLVPENGALHIDKQRQ